jgi:hypothetical protein
MEMIEFFAQVVNNIGQPLEKNQYFNQLSEDIQRAMLSQDGDHLKSLLDPAYLANESHVVQIQRS